MALIDVVVPVYNGIDNIERCIKSIINQTLKEFRLYIIDDGSTDGTTELCKKFVNTDDRIVLISNKVNKGVGFSRYLGMLEGNSEWVSFVDADDELELCFLEKLYLETRESNLDVVCCKVNCKNKVAPNSRSEEIPNSVLKDGKEVFWDEYYFEKGLLGRSVLWAKIVRRALLEKICRDNIRLLDIAPRVFLNDHMMMNVWYTSRKVCMIESSLYNFYLNKDSLSHRKSFSKHQYDWIIAYGEQVGFCISNFEYKVASVVALRGLCVLQIYYIRLLTTKDSNLRKCGIHRIDEYIRQYGGFISFKSITKLTKLPVLLQAIIFIHSRVIWRYTFGILLRIKYL